MLNTTTVYALLECLLALCFLASLAGLGFTLIRAAGLADRRSPHPLGEITAINRDQVERWRDVGALTPIGYARLCRLMLMDAGQTNTYPYWSGGRRYGTPCIWAYNRRYTLTEWNDESAAIAATGTGGAA